jgi:hypothetical protein
MPAKDAANVASAWPASPQHSLPRILGSRGSGLPPIQRRHADCLFHPGCAGAQKCRKVQLLALIYGAEHRAAARERLCPARWLAGEPTKAGPQRDGAQILELGASGTC